MLVVQRINPNYTKNGCFSWFFWYDWGRGDDMILRTNTHNKSREWSRFDMMSNWDIGKSHKYLRSTWWIFGKQLYRSGTWSWSMFWSGI